MTPHEGTVFQSRTRQGAGRPLRPRDPSSNAAKRGSGEDPSPLGRGASGGRAGGQLDRAGCGPTRSARHGAIAVAGFRPGRRCRLVKGSAPKAGGIPGPRGPREPAGTVVSTRDAAEAGRGSEGPGRGEPAAATGAPFAAFEGKSFRTAAGPAERRRHPRDASGRGLWSSRGRPETGVRQEGPGSVAESARCSARSVGRTGGKARGAGPTEPRSKREHARSRVPWTNGTSEARAPPTLRPGRFGSRCVELERGFACGARSRWVRRAEVRGRMRDDVRRDGRRVRA